MARIAILGDTHFGARGDSPLFDDHFQQFYEQIFFPYLEKNSIEHVIQLGDVFDRRKYVNFNTLKRCKKYFFERLNSSYKSWLLVGNHDTFYKNTTKVNSLDLLLSGYQNIHSICSPFETSFDGTSILFLPWICPENEQEVLDAISLSKSQICCGHFEIQGFEMYKGTVIDHGISPSVFNKFELVLSGHYHHKSTKSNITYCGTPYEMTWSDFDDQKGFHILDTNTRELEFIPNTLPMFCKIHYNDLDKQMSDVLVDDFSIYKNCITKVIVTNKTNPYWFDLFIEKLEGSGVSEIQVVDDHLNLNQEEDEDLVNEAEDTLTIVNKYVSQMVVDSNKQDVENLMRSLYSEAMTLE